MKHITKFAFIGAIIASFGVSAALADDPQLQNRLSLQRAQDLGANRVSTVAVYANRKGITRTTKEERPKLRFEIRTRADGQPFNVYTAAE